MAEIDIYMRECVTPDGEVLGKARNYDEALRILDTDHADMYHGSVGDLPGHPAGRWITHYRDYPFGKRKADNG